eukprot:m.185610 g.185610  ORF g.185610 m.185610 type:complete len:782 (+) comp17503_c2_seq1:372-2717(+)
MSLNDTCEFTICIKSSNVRNGSEAVVIAAFLAGIAFNCLSIMLTYYEFRRVLPKKMFAPGRLYYVRLLLVLQSIYRSAFFVYEDEIVSLYSVVTGVLYAVVVSEFLVLLVQDFCGYRYLKHYWLINTFRLCILPSLPFVLFLMADDKFEAVEVQSVNYAFSAVWFGITFLMLLTFVWVASSYRKTRRMLDEGRDPPMSLARFPTSIRLISTLTAMYMMLVLLMFARGVMNGLSQLEFFQSGHGVRFISTGYNLFVFEAVPSFILVIIESIRQKPSFSFYWLVLNYPEYEPDRARAIPWADLRKGGMIASGAHKILYNGFWLGTPVAIALPTDDDRRLPLFDGGGGGFGYANSSGAYRDALSNGNPTAGGGGGGGGGGAGNANNSANGGGGGGFSHSGNRFSAYMKLGLDNTEAFRKKVNALYDEGALLRSLNHPNIIALYGATVVRDLDLQVEHAPPALVMEQASCTLRDHLADAGFDADYSVMLRMMRDICSAVVYLHDRYIYHKDIKSDNILVARDGHTLKIADFSSVHDDYISPSAAAPEVLALRLSPGERRDAMRAGDERMRHSSDGCLQWVLDMHRLFGLRKVAEDMADVYSCGLVFCNIFTRECHLYEGTDQSELSLFLLKLTMYPTYNSELQGEELEYVFSQNKQGNPLQRSTLKIIQQCCANLPTDRPSMRAVLENVEAYQEVFTTGFRRGAPAAHRHQSHLQHASSLTGHARRRLSDGTADDRSIDSLEPNSPFGVVNTGAGADGVGGGAAGGVGVGGGAAAFSPPRTIICK